MRVKRHVSVTINRPDRLPRVLAFTVWLAALFTLLAVTNHGFLQRLQLLSGQERWGTIVGFVGIWGLCVVALLIAAFQTRWWLRGLWAVLFAIAATVAVAFHTTSGTELTIFDMMSLWSARHEATRAAEFYGSESTWPALILIASMLVVMVRPPLQSAAAKRWIGRLAFAPLVPMIAIASITFVKEGGGTEALPVQFAPLSVSAVMGVKLASQPIAVRRSIDLQPGTAKIRHIVVLVDESVRGDYIDFTPGNESTPELAKLSDRIVDFGLATSGGNCSHYSNAILRFAAGPHDLGGPILQNPTIWQYAHKAGFQTVFIDAQSGFNKNPSKLQNFMTAGEAADIDRLYTMEDDAPAETLDYRLLDIIEKELRSDKPTLIYANKNGAHFPYDQDYPKSEQIFRPVLSDLAEDTAEGRINSYRNAVSWTVDKFFARLFGEQDLKDTVVLYTSDHGQVFEPHAFTHCSVENPNPREGIVPLFVSTGDANLKARFAQSAAAGVSRTHFAIMPTVLSLLGYPEVGIAREAGTATLFDPAHERTAFSSGDIFGLFSHDVRWHDVDLGKDYRETPADEMRISEPAEPVRPSVEQNLRGGLS